MAISNDLVFPVFSKDAFRRGCAAKPDSDQTAKSRHPATKAKAILWTALFSAATLLSVCTTATACLSAGDHSSIFLDEVPPEFFSDATPSLFRANVAAQVTVIKLLESGKKSVIPRDRYRASYQGLARVDRVITGTINEPIIKLIAPGFDCDFPFSLGKSGVVAGKLIRDSQGALELRALPDSPSARDRRKKRAAPSRP